MESQLPSAKLGIVDEIKSFFTNRFKTIFVTFFVSPIDGVRNMFSAPSEKVYIESLMLFGYAFVVYLLGFYILIPDMPGSLYVKLALTPLIYMLITAVLAYAVKKQSGTPNFKNELQVGGVSGIPLSLLVLVALILKFTLSSRAMQSIMQEPQKVGLFGGFSLLYVLLMLINTFQHSLKSAGTKDSIAWYASPACVLVSFYITGKIAFNIFS